MDTKQTELKPLPNTISKQKFENLFNGILPENMLRREINEIIYENRKKLKGYDSQTREKIIKTQTILSSEIIEFAETFGIPKGYFIPK